ncbi:pyridoxamine 5'-phosphate oxidase-like protein [Glaciihabitans tibetensis]|uniref:Pyridoxamine 5'-phosphate oxidase-like protein n=1 Tax=Glaciihabitans tibetensis TaxID=1266600 RepID=A0A2T0VFR1_9MICO|nr:pyridoxamine 5'-phosphate oxidase family protein [Glaciihabitans tibetensis]PRY69048.1 pyridoxamine 5'-phosphate oxidase-like protein [Glaciihabitans tibetensis]
MDRRQITAELEQPGASELLVERPVVRLAYTGTDGFPRVIPIGFLWTRGLVVVCTATTSPKVAALSARPEVALTLDVGDTPADAKALLIRGSATLDTVDGIPDEYLKAAAKNLAPEDLAEFETQVRTMYAQMVRISIEPTWARYFDFGAGRMPRFLEEMADAAAATSGDALHRG